MTIFATSAYPLVLVIIPLVVYLLSRRGKKWSAPTNWPLIGMLPTAIHNMHRVHDYLTEILTEFGGTVKFKGPWFCNLDLVFTSDPANIKHVFNKNFSNYPKGPEYTEIFETFGDGIFAADFDLWEIHRKTTHSYFSHENFSSCLERNVWHKVKTGLVPVLDYFCEDGSAVDLQDILQRFTFDGICKLVLDYDPCSLSVEMPFIPCEKAISDFTKHAFHRYVIPKWIWKLQKWLKIGGEKKLAEASKAFDEFIYPIVNAGEQQDLVDFNLLRTYRKVYEDKDICTSRGLTDFLKDTAFNLIFAGMDSTSTVLTWLFWLIALNPSTEIKIREEIETVVLLHSKKWRFFDAQESRKLIYLHGALCESLRLYPPVSLEHKAPVRPDILPSGHYLRVNTKLIFSFYSIGRMESVWGEDCLKFKPERWITPGGGIKQEPTYKFPAFNSGPRTCLGKEMSFIQMKMVAATIIYHYNVQLVEGHPVVPRDSIILQTKHGLMVKLSKRIV